MDVPVPKGFCRVIMYGCVAVLLAGAVLMLPLGMYLADSSCALGKLLGAGCLLLGTGSAVTVIRILPVR